METFFLEPSTKLDWPTEPADPKCAMVFAHSSHDNQGPFSPGNLAWMTAKTDKRNWGDANAETSPCPVQICTPAGFPLLFSCIDKVVEDARLGRMPVSKIGGFSAFQATHMQVRTEFAARFRYPSHEAMRRDTASIKTVPLDKGQLQSVREKNEVVVQNVIVSGCDKQESTGIWVWQGGSFIQKARMKKTDTTTLDAIITRVRSEFNCDRLMFFGCQMFGWERPAIGRWNFDDRIISISHAPIKERAVSIGPGYRELFLLRGGRATQQVPHIEFGKAPDSSDLQCQQISWDGTTSTLAFTVCFPKSEHNPEFTAHWKVTFAEDGATAQVKTAETSEYDFTFHATRDTAEAAAMLNIPTLKCFDAYG